MAPPSTSEKRIFWSVQRPLPIPPGTGRCSRAGPPPRPPPPCVGTAAGARCPRPRIPGRRGAGRACICRAACSSRTRALMAGPDGADGDNQLGGPADDGGQRTAAEACAAAGAPHRVVAGLPSPGKISHAAAGCDQRARVGERGVPVLAAARPGEDARRKDSPSSRSICSSTRWSGSRRHARSPLHDHAGALPRGTTASARTAGGTLPAAKARRARWSEPARPRSPARPRKEASERRRPGGVPDLADALHGDARQEPDLQRALDVEMVAEGAGNEDLVDAARRPAPCIARSVSIPARMAPLASCRARISVWEMVRSAPSAVSRRRGEDEAMIAVRDPRCTRGAPACSRPVCG